MKPVLWRIVKIGLPVLVALGALAPFIPASFLRGRVESALANSLNRPVNVGDVRFSFFPNGPVPGPGFVLENVTIHEAPRFGIEPFAYMQELGVSVRILGLLAGQLQFSGINLDEASINMVKTADGQWNFQHLLSSLKAQDAAIPAFRMRGGRVDFKFGDTKSVFFFNQADLNISPSSTGSMEVRFSGEPSRTDHTKQDFGRFFIRGSYSASNRLDLQVELLQSSLEETLRLMDPQGFGVHGVLAIDGRLTGEPSHLEMTGKVRIGDIHRWDLLPESNQAWQLPYKAVIDLKNEVIDWESVPSANGAEPIFGARFHAEHYLSRPQWSAGADFRAMPLATLFEIARHMGATLPANLTIAGSVSGSASYDERSGLKGQLHLTEASLQLPENEPLQAAEASLEIREGAIYLKPAKIAVGATQSAQLEGHVALAYPHALDLRVSTAGLNVIAMRSFGLAAIPVLGASPQGTWKGWIRYQNEKWTGAAELRNGRLSLDGFAEPLTVRTAAVSLTPMRMIINRIAGRIADTPFSGSYEAAGTRPVKFTLEIEEADAAELERLLTPTLAREGPGFLARTLRLRSAPPAPEWLKARRAEGTISIGTVTAGEWKAEDLKARVVWNGTNVEFTGITAGIDTATVTGTAEWDLATPVAKVHLEGAVNGVSYRGGILDISGTVDAEGIGDQLLQTARAEGTTRGRTIAFAPDAEFRSFTAAFQMQPVGTAPRWKLSNVEASQGNTTLLGTGASQDDGRIQLDLSQGDRQVRYSGALFAARQQGK